MHPDLHLYYGSSWRRRRESNPGTGICSPLPKPLGHAARSGEPYWRACGGATLRASACAPRGRPSGRASSAFVVTGAAKPAVLLNGLAAVLPALHVVTLAALVRD